ncbi:hypothetical protein [Alkaliphilus sp. B6464]|uniref:hypothetical protein n=1 Tax=Alkaliphilus sp. B6464 TaxID=2731219 RepID=UPI001BA5E325|nr:hypothetical protein [Alkaliphilus sp. B6464]QUH20213.1 hypothetical protein HYG84_10035 [Alkaliphilus sp. B6464]
MKQIGKYKANEYIVNVFNSMRINTGFENETMLEIIAEHMGNVLENIDDDIMLNKDDINVVISIEQDQKDKNVINVNILAAMTNENIINIEELF